MILDLIYPPVCGICNKINKKSLCIQCEKSIKKNEIYKIERTQGRYFDYQIKILKYKDIVRDKIIDYKFNEKAYLYKTFTKIILKNKKVYGFLKKYDIIINVPMHIRRKFERGYNQTELIAREIAKNIDIQFERNNLIKVKNTVKQSTLNKAERVNNIKGAFEIRNNNKIKNKRVVLFDDIYTTGSTVNECSKILKQAGALEIAVLTLATD